MAKTESPPFGRGETYYGGNPIDANDLGGVTLEGMEFEHEDLDYSVQGAKPTRTNRQVRTRIVRNVSGGALLPKRTVAYQTSKYGARVDRYPGPNSAGDFAGVVDEWLPAAGVPNNDLFHIVVRGPSNCLTEIDGGGAAAISAGSIVVSMTGASTGATTAGRVIVQTIAGTTSVLGDSLQNAVGRALSTTTSTQTNSNILVDVKEI